MKRLILSVVITAVLGLTAYTMAGAQDPGRERGFGPGGPGGRGGPGRGAWSLLRGADLTDDQQAQIKEIREAARELRDGPPPELDLHRQLQTEIFADAPDAQKLTTLKQQIAQAHAAQLAKRVTADQKVAQVLTAEQRAKVREQLAEPGAYGRGRRPGQPAK